MKRRITKGISYVLLGLAITGTAYATEVNCSAGETIAAALNGKFQGRTINVKGVCNNEPDNTVTIMKDDVTLNGITPDAAVHGLISIEGANRAVIENLTVTGPLIGISVTNGASATIRNSKIIGNDDVGINISTGAFVTMEFNEIMNNGEDGVAVFRGSVVRSRENVISGHSFAGVEVAQHSAFISQPRSGEVGDVITAFPGQYGVVVTRHSYADLRDFTVNGDMKVGGTSELNMRGRSVESSVDGDILALALSYVLKNNSRAGVVVNGVCTTVDNSLCTGF